MPETALCPCPVRVPWEGGAVLRQRLPCRGGGAAADPLPPLPRHLPDLPGCPRRRLGGGRGGGLPHHPPLPGGPDGVPRGWPRLLPGGRGTWRC